MRIREITHKDKEKRRYTEPFPAIKYDGDYNTVNTIVGLIGIDTLDWSENATRIWNSNKKWFPDSFIDTIVDPSSAKLTLPGVLNDEYYPPVKLEVNVGDWIYIETDLKNTIFPIVVTDEKVRESFLVK